MPQGWLSRGGTIGAVALCLLPSQAGALHPDYVRGENAFLAREWARTIETLVPHWREGYRTPGAAYYIGASMCMLNARQGGRSWLDYALGFPKVTSQQAAAVRTALEACARPVAPGSTYVAIRSDFAWRGELLYFGASARVRAKPLIVTKPVPPAAIASRQVRLGDISGRDRLAGELKSSIDTAFGDTPSCRFVQPSRVIASGRFLFVTRLPAQRVLLDGWAARLEAYLAELKARTGAEPPDRYITIYLARCAEDAQRMAMAMHGLEINMDQVAGYSVEEDSSLLSLWASEAATGDSYTMRTIRHELAHLVLRERFGDIPEWLDEGVAQYMGVLAAGRKTASTTVLPPAWGELPALAEVVRSRFDAVGGAPAESRPCERISQVMMAADVARMFIAHVDAEPGRLKTLVERLRGLVLEPDKPAPSDVAVIEQLFGKPLASLNADYQAAATIEQDSSTAHLFGDSDDTDLCEA